PVTSDRQQPCLRRRFSKRQRYAVPIRATGGQSLLDIRIDQCGRCSLLPGILAVVMATPPENLRTVDGDRSSISSVSRRFPTRRWNAFFRLLTCDSQSASKCPFSARTQDDSLNMFESSISPCRRPGRPLRRTYVDGVSSPKEMNRREASPSQT